MGRELHHFHSSLKNFWKSFRIKLLCTDWNLTFNLVWNCAVKWTKILLPYRGSARLVDFPIISLCQGCITSLNRFTKHYRVVDVFVFGKHHGVISRSWCVLWWCCFSTFSISTRCGISYTWWMRRASSLVFFRSQENSFTGTSFLHNYGPIPTLRHISTFKITKNLSSFTHECPFE